MQNHLCLQPQGLHSLTLAHNEHLAIYYKFLAQCSYEFICWKISKHLLCCSLQMPACLYRLGLAVHTVISVFGRIQKSVWKFPGFCYYSYNGRLVVFPIQHPWADNRREWEPGNEFLRFCLSFSIDTPVYQFPHNVDHGGFTSSRKDLYLHEAHKISQLDRNTN